MSFVDEMSARLAARLLVENFVIAVDEVPSLDVTLST
jgi:hypothetical protein